MPQRPNFYYNNPYLGQIANNLSAAIYGGPELEGKRLENQRKQQEIDDAYEARLERGRQQGYEDEFWRQYAAKQPTISVDPEQADNNADFKNLTGVDNPFWTNEEAPGSLLERLQTDPALMELGVRSGAIKVSDLQRAEEARYLRELTGDQRMDQVLAQIASREGIADARNATALDIAGMRTNAQLQAVNQRLAFNYAKLAQERDPLARRQIETQIALDEATIGLRVAQTNYTNERATTEQTTRGFKPNQIQAADYVQMRQAIEQQIAATGQQVDPAALNMMVNMALELQNTTGYADLGSIVSGPQFTQGSTPERFFGLAGGDPQIQLAPQGAPPTQAPARAPAQAGGAPVVINSPQERDALPSGTRYIAAGDPKRTVRVRP